jgi:hypothetical protein
MARRVGRAAGWLLLLVPFVPLTAWFGEIERSQGLVPPSEALLGVFVFGAAALLLARFMPSGAPDAALRRLDRKGGVGSALTGASFVALAILLTTAAILAFSRRPLLIDSVIQLFQARIFASGRLWATAPPDGAFFAVQHMLVDGSRWYSQYPPGHSALLALGVLGGAPWLVPVTLSLGTAALLYGFARRAYDLATARITVFALAAAPFFWFMGASHMSHVSTLFFSAAFVFLLARWEDRGGRTKLFLAGMAIGAAFLCRPLTAVAVGIVLAPSTLRTAWRRGEASAVASGMAGVALAVLVFLAYNAATTGDPLLPGYVKLWGREHGLGFHATPWGDVHSPVAGLRNELTDLALLTSFLFEWPIPALCLAGLLFAAGWATHRWDHRLLAAFLAIPAAYFFYWHRDAFLGPRYLYSGLAFLVPLTARGLVELFRRLEGRQIWAGSALTRVGASGTAATLIVLCTLYSWTYATPRRFEVYRSGLASMKVDLPAAAGAAGIREAVIFVPVSWGNRLLARMRGLGVPAAATETAYRVTDHCALEQVVSRAERESWGAARTTRAIGALPRGGSPVPLDDPGSNGDRTLRLTAGRPLVGACLAELTHDGLGYGNYSPFLADLEPALDGPLVIARDLRDRNPELVARYRGFPAVVYRRGRFVPLLP